METVYTPQTVDNSKVIGPNHGMVDLLYWPDALELEKWDLTRSYERRRAFDHKGQPIFGG